MSYSLNETDALAKRAARGAGLDWGLAEEAGKATRWLCAQGLDGCTALVWALEEIDGKPRSRHAPRTLDGIWRAPTGSLCALLAGPAISDCAARLAEHPLELHRVNVPALLLPFAAAAATTLQDTVSVTWNNVEAVTDGVALGVEGDPMTSTAADLRIAVGGTLANPRATVQRASPPSRIWDRLATIAHRTYAPATEASRLLGAGEG